ncbi:MAG TPA: adenylyl-sulfate kinase [Bacillota bacterium]|nr:adenylyl-sulfate kinase [Bacillota bacterium]
MTEAKFIKWHDSKVTKENRRELNKHGSTLVWFTGLSGSGKSTISVEVEQELHKMGIRTYRLDGDNIRHGLNQDLGFSQEDRTENIRRIGEVAKLMVDAGMIVLSAFISPNKDDRNRIREQLGVGEFIEVYIDARLETCESRDPKGLYKKMRAGEMRGLTGIDAPYDVPLNPEVKVDTDKNSVEESVQVVMSYLKRNGYLAW